MAPSGRANLRGCALESVQPCQSHGLVRASPLGSEDLPERQKRRRTRRCARSRPAHAPPTIRDSWHTHTLTHFCARYAQAVPHSSSPSSPPSLPASSPPSPSPTNPPLPSPPGSRSSTCSWLRPRVQSGTPDCVHSRPFASTCDVLRLEVAVGVCGVRWDRCEAHHCAFVQVCVLSWCLPPVTIRRFHHIAPYMSRRSK